MILSDNETKVDLINNEAIAKTIVFLIKVSEEQPISIGIHAFVLMVGNIRVLNTQRLL